MRETGAATPVGADLPWARLSKSGAADQAVNNNTGPRISWTDFQTSDAAVFTQSGDFLRVHEDGLYSLLLRIIWTTVTDHWDAHVFFDNIDSDAGFNTVFPARGSTRDAMTTAHGTFRLAANQTIAAYVFQHSGANWSISGIQGTYFEMQRLGSATMGDRASL